MTLRFLIVLFSLLTFLQSVSGQNKTDSLLNLLDTYLEAEQKEKAAEVYVQLFFETDQRKDITALQYAGTALQMYAELGDSSNIAYTHRLIGSNYLSRDILPMAMRSFTKSLEIYSHLNDEKQIAYSHLKIGQVYFAQKLTNRAQESYEKAVKIFKAEQDKKGTAEAFDLLAEVIINDQEQNDNKAFALLDSALDIRKKLKDDALTAKSYESIADAYFFLEDYETAAEYLDKALAKYKITRNKIKQADAHFSFGEKYLFDKQYTHAESSFIKAMEIYEKSELFEKLCKTYNKLAEVYLETGNFEQSKDMAQKALSISLWKNYRKIRKNAYYTLSRVYARAGSHEAAYDYLNRFTLLSDTLRMEDQYRQSTEMQVNLATQKKEQEIHILRQTQKLQDAQIAKNEAEQKGLYIGLALLGFILILLAVFGYYYYKTNKKTKLAYALLVEKSEEINQQKEEIQAQRDKLRDANTAITKQRDEIEAKSEKIEASLHYASRIQRAMQPKMKEIRKELPESFVMLSPKEAVSGDFYWYAKAKDEKGYEKLLITAVDCTGHGVPGAFMSMLGDAYLTQIVYQRNIFSPEVILTELHKGIATSLQQDKTNNTDGMDMAICVIDPKSKTLEYAGAKNPLAYVREGELHTVKGDHVSIGGISRGLKRNYKKHIIDLDKPATFYIYSDGFQDQFGGKYNKKYMAKRFRMFLQEISNQPINDQAVSLAVELDEWKGERQQMDDILVIGFRIDFSA